MSCKSLAKVIRQAKQDMAADLGDAVPAVVFDDLGVEQAGIDTPGTAAFTLTPRLRAKRASAGVVGLHPGSKVGGQLKEVKRQAIAGEYRKTVRCRTFGDLVEQLMSDPLTLRFRGQASWVRAPRAKAGMSLVLASQAIHSHVISFAP